MLFEEPAFRLMVNLKINQAQFELGDGSMNVKDIEVKREGIPELRPKTSVMVGR